MLPSFFLSSFTEILFFTNFVDHNTVTKTKNDNKTLHNNNISVIIHHQHHNNYMDEKTWTPAGVWCRHIENVNIWIAIKFLLLAIVDVYNMLCVGILYTLCCIVMLHLFAEYYFLWIGICKAMTRISVAEWNLFIT